MKDTAINWADSTFNAWQGCTKVSPGCKNCYAEAMDRRNLHDSISHWGPGAPRKVMSDDYWRQPLAWERAAAKAGERHRVFSSSVADVFDMEAPAGQRERLWNLIRQTPNLDWLLLTKRPQNIMENLPDDWGIHGYSHVWLGVSVENKEHGLPRVDSLRRIPAAIRFLSVEPLLEDLGPIDLHGIDWVIVGGESGRRARPFDIEWAASVIEQCQQQNVPVWVKQLGKNPVEHDSPLVIIGANGRPSGHAEEFGEWPKHLGYLQVRELPVSAASLTEPGPDESQIARMESALGELASGLEPDAAEQERQLRHQIIRVERSLFLSRQEKGRILRDYHGLYGPLRKWSEFLRIVGVARQTAYDLMTADAKPGNCTESGQSEQSVHRQPRADPEHRVRASIRRGLASLPDPAQRALVRELAEEYGLIEAEEPTAA